MKKLRVIIRGYYGLGNFGDDALAHATAIVMQKQFHPEEFAFQTPEASYLTRLVQGRCISAPPEKSTFCDLLLYSGGTQFFSFPLTYRQNLRLGAKLRFCICNPSKVVSTLRRHFSSHTPRFYFSKAAAIGIGCGPFVNGSPEKSATEALFKSFDFLAIRDIGSAELCQEWGIKSVCLGADLCYLPGFWTAKGGARSRSQHDGQMRVGVVVRDWPHTHEGAAYFGPLEDLVARLRTIGLDVAYILFQKSDETWRARLHSLGESVLIWNPDGDTIDGFLQKLSTFDCFITARYHGAVVSSILGKPVVCIEVEPKLKMISEALGIGAPLWEQPFDPEVGEALVQEILSTYQTKVASLAKSVREQSDLAVKMEAEFQTRLRDIKDSCRPLGPLL
jgi:polysaccharide pyruvyl transferase WcaK-like protein